MEKMTNQPNKATVKDGLPTAKKVLAKHYDVDNSVDESAIAYAMQSYSDQQNAELMSEIERWKEVAELGKKSIRELIKANEKLESVESENAELLAWKESAMKELNQLDLQSLAKKLGIGLGQSVSANVHNKVDGLLERVKELEGTIAGYKECFEQFVPESKWDEATAFLSSYGNGLAKDFQRKENQ